MSIRTKVFLATMFVVGAALAAPAKDKAVPKIDIEKTCQANTTALATPMGGEMKANFDSCVADEKMALEQITKDWSGYPASARAQCLQPDEYLPGYVEWLVCLEMTRDVMKKREQPTTANASDASSSTTVGSSAKRQTSNRRTRPAHKDCPIVVLNKDGSIASVDACPLGPPY